ncbi:Dual-specificity kinase, spindle pole body (SPB) duplication and spindle checkpoint function [Mortierella alpina]|nr:Dual-specificity kinase, spindle pole body (SPB) duplication and spindle checkpoint function [Mortierella alpina]
MLDIAEQDERNGTASTRQTLQDNTDTSRDRPPSSPPLSPPKPYKILPLPPPTTKKLLRPVEILTATSPFAAVSSSSSSRSAEAWLSSSSASTVTVAEGQWSMKLRSSGSADDQLTLADKESRAESDEVAPITVQDAKGAASITNNLPYRSVAGKENVIPRTPRTAARTRNLRQNDKMRFNPSRWGRPLRDASEISQDQDDIKPGESDDGPSSGGSQPAEGSQQEEQGYNNAKVDSSPELPFQDLHVQDVSTRKPRAREDSIGDYGDFGLGSATKKPKHNTREDPVPNSAGKRQDAPQLISSTAMSSTTISATQESGTPRSSLSGSQAALATSERRQSNQHPPVTSPIPRHSHFTQSSTPPRVPSPSPLLFKTPQEPIKRPNSIDNRRGSLGGSEQTNRAHSQTNAKDPLVDQQPHHRHFKPERHPLLETGASARNYTGIADSLAQPRSSTVQARPTATTAPAVGGEAPLTSESPSTPIVTAVPQTHPTSASPVHVSAPLPTSGPTATVTLAQALSLAKGIPSSRTPIPASGHASGLAPTIPRVSVPIAAPVPTSVPTAPAAAPTKQENRVTIYVNGRAYTRLNLIGKGGSSKVFKVLAHNNRIFALKRVIFAKADQSTIEGYINEVQLLNRLRYNPRIVRLWDSELQLDQGYLTLLMELGEIDLASLLVKQRMLPHNLSFIRLYWEQMLEAVQTIHEEKIVHTDLKPANFLLVEGSLKLIDFGIANTIANDTTNIHREGQLGTANYMAPESITSNPLSGDRKMGRASDVWSLGCILYQMVYGKTPFADITNVFKKLAAITNPEIKIQFPAQTLSPLQLPLTQQQQQQQQQQGQQTGTTVGTNVPSDSTAAALAAKQSMVPVDADLLRIMRCCLDRDAKNRRTIPELLQDPFLKPHTSPSVPSTSSSLPPGSVAVDVEMLTRIMDRSIEFAAKRGNKVTQEELKVAAKDMMKQLQAHEFKDTGAG